MIQKVNMKIKILLIGFIIIFSLNCNEDNKLQNQTTSNLVLDSIKIPERFRELKYLLLKKSIEKNLGLEEIDKGFNGEEVRIWIGYGFTNSSQGLVLRKMATDKVWHATFFHYSYIRKKSGEAIEVKKKIWFNLKPKSGWDAFWSKLNKINFLYLRDYRELYAPQTNGGEGFKVEYANKKMYRAFGYVDLFTIENKFEEIDQAKKAIIFINDELSLTDSLVFYFQSPGCTIPEHNWEKKVLPIFYKK